jgi:hypothetical protein
VSFTLELRGRTTVWWPLTSTCIEQIEKLGATASRRAVELLFGDDKTEDGTLRTVPRQDLLDAVREIALEAKKIPGGFQFRMPPIVEGMKSRVRGGGFSGLLINGKYHMIKCFSDHWTLREVGEGKPEPAPRYDTAEIATENFGIIKVWPKKSASSELSKLAQNVQKFLEDDPGDEIQIIWG